jgi:hypothetical protein
METTFKEDKWDEYRDGGDHIVACLLLGENFAMHIEERNEKVDFYIFVYTETNFMVEKPFTCPWGQQFCVGDMVVTRKYY